MATHTSPRQKSVTMKLRAHALTTARIQFTGQSPAALAHAAEELYQWMCTGTVASAPEPDLDNYSRAVRRLVAQGVDYSTALHMIHPRAH